MTEYKPINMDRTESRIYAEPKPFNVSEELQKAMDAVLGSFASKSFSARHPELGKMVNCRVCGTRHRQTDNVYRNRSTVNKKLPSELVSVGRKCEQVFTYTTKEEGGNGSLLEHFRENEEGKIVPDYRTALRPDENPTKRQVNGSAAYAKKRFHPHLSGYKNVFVERTRKVFEELGFDISADKEVFQKNLQRARVLAAREIREEQELKARAVRRRQDRSRRINKGLL